MQTVEQVKQALQWARPVRSLAALIRVAVEDGREVLAERPDIRPDWAVWYRSAHAHGPCTVCFGGAVMLGTMDGLGKHRLEDCDVIGSHQLRIQYRTEQYEALVALDRARRGDLRGAYTILGRWYRSDGKACPKVTAFREDVIALQVARQRHDPAGGLTSAPAHREFKAREQFDGFLDSVEELADQLDEIEAEHLKEAA